jgi:hypothetical protein
MSRDTCARCLATSHWCRRGDLNPPPPACKPGPPKRCSDQDLCSSAASENLEIIRSWIRVLASLVILRRLRSWGGLVMDGTTDGAVAEALRAARSRIDAERLIRRPVRRAEDDAASSPLPGTTLTTCPSMSVASSTGLPAGTSRRSTAALTACLRCGPPPGDASRRTPIAMPPVGAA